MDNDSVATLTGVLVPVGTVAKSESTCTRVFVLGVVGWADAVRRSNDAFCGVLSAAFACSASTRPWSIGASVVSVCD